MDAEMRSKVAAAFGRSFAEGVVVGFIAYAIYMITLLALVGAALWSAPKVLGVAFVGKAKLTMASIISAIVFWSVLLIGLFRKPLWGFLKLLAGAVKMGFTAAWSLVRGLFRKKQAQVHSIG